MRYPTLHRPESRRLDVALLLMLLVGSWMLGRTDISRQLQLIGAIRGSVLAPFLTVHGAMAGWRDLGDRADALQAERDSLSRRLLELSGVAEENARLRLLVGLRERYEQDFLVTEVVSGRPVIGESHTFLVRAGSREGVRAPVGAYTATGLVGVVRSAGERSAIGEFWTHPEFAVSVRTEGGEATGIVRAVPVDGGVAMRLHGAPYQIEITPGTRLVTAGVGGIHPPGIPVGTVRERTEVNGRGWEKSYLVEPAVRPEEAGVVLLWRRGPLDPDAAGVGGSEAGVGETDTARGGGG